VSARNGSPIDNSVVSTLYAEKGNREDFRRLLRAVKRGEVGFAWSGIPAAYEFTLADQEVLAFLAECGCIIEDYRTRVRIDGETAVVDWFCLSPRGTALLDLLDDGRVGRDGTA